VKDVLGRVDTVRRLALASIIANVGIVITGGAVRLTGSGLGCPTWPRCTDASYAPTTQSDIYMYVEFGNRLLTFVVGLIALLGLISALMQRPRRRRLTVSAAVVLAGIPAQAIVGGITVLTNLNPWVVGCHFLVSMGVIAAAYSMWAAARESDGPGTATVPAALRQLTHMLVAMSGAVLVVGTMVTGSGPHAGDADARRNELNPETISQVHADLVFLLLGLTVAAWFAFSAVGAARARERTGWLFVVILCQGLIGFVQYFMNLPGLLVGAHMAGSCLVWLATLAVWFATRGRTDYPGKPTSGTSGSTSSDRSTTAPPHPARTGV
jgi:cytochrome c oxidase assembly protein subunit 15